MIKRVFFGVAWFLTMLGALALGVFLNDRRWKNRSYNQIKAEYLVADMSQDKTIDVEAARGVTAVECLKNMWGRPLPGRAQSEMEGVYSNGFLVKTPKSSTWLQSLLWEEAKEERISLLSKKINTPLEEKRWMMRAYRLIPLWTLGQSDIRLTPCPFPKAEAPLWALYLSNPEEAWRRGVDLDGRGGR